MALLELAAESNCAAPVTVAREHLATTNPRYLLINSGNANAGTGARGLEDARSCCEAVAKLTGCAVNEVLPFSTGVIGQTLPVEKIKAALPTAVAALDGDAWQQALNQAVETSFNRITVDSDTSTNDACVLIATGKGVAIDSTEHPAFMDFCKAVTDICLELAQAIVRDGEGATKFITVSVEQAASEQECLDVAYTIAHSPLVKTAFFASSRKRRSR